MGYVDFEIPQELFSTLKEVLVLSSETGKIRKGSNEVTKAIERGIAKLVVIAKDVTPEEIVIHLPLLCKDKDVCYAFFPSKNELGQAVGLKVGTAAVAIVDAGNADTLLRDLTEKLKSLKT